MSSDGVSVRVSERQGARDRRPGRGGGDRREQLLDAADRVIRSTGSAASMNDIAAEAGITKPILYRHFGDKGGLYTALADRYIGRLRERLAAALLTRGGLGARTRATIDAYLAAIEEEPEVYRFLVQRAAFEDPGVAGEVAGFVRRFAADLASGLTLEPQLSGVSETSAAVIAHAIAGMVQQTGDYWLDTRDLPREMVVDQLSQLLLDGLLG
jgi:AcrR family transcriptional regulator